MRATDRNNRRLAVEAAAFGVGYASVLCWASTCLVAAFAGARRVGVRHTLLAVDGLDAAAKRAAGLVRADVISRW